MNARHGVGTAVDGWIRAVATMQSYDGKLFRFKVDAFDEAGAIGTSEHARAIVSVDRLLAGAQKRVPRPAGSA